MVLYILNQKTCFFSAASPLDQFTVRNLFSLKADLLGNINLSLTNIGLYLSIASLIVLALFTFARNYDLTKPNAWSLGIEAIYATVFSIVTNQINSNKFKIKILWLKVRII